MLVIRNYRQGLVVGETEKSYSVKRVADKAVWWPKINSKLDFDYQAFQTAMHLWAGYQSEFIDAKDSIDNVANISKYVPVILEAERKVDLQVQNGLTGWDKVFDYDVTYEAGVWLAKHPNAWLDKFEAYVEELIK